MYFHVIEILTSKMESKSVIVIVILAVVLAQVSMFKAFSRPATISEKKIIGGRKSVSGAVPYLVALTGGDIDTGLQVLFCGGALVTTRSMITAAHCIAAVFDEDVGALVSSLRGTVGTNNWKSGGQTYSFSHNVTYPLASGTKYDLGFLYFSQCVMLSNDIKLVPFDFDYVDPGVTTKVAGWGKIMRRGTMSHDVYELLVDTIDEDTCLNRASAVYHATSYYIDYQIEICTYHSPNHGTCNGDSGSPLVRTDKATLIGCVSWGFPCARGGPDMYVRFSTFKDWITQNLIDDC